MYTRRLMNRFAGLILVMLMVLPWLLAGPSPVAAQNLLKNGDMEQSHGNGMDLTAPPNWQVWSNAGSGLVGRSLPRGQEIASNVGVYQGNASFDAYKGWSAYRVVIYQNVEGLQAGSTVRASAFGRIWSCNLEMDDNDPCLFDPIPSESNTNATFRVGIDPTGAMDPNGANIVWSSPSAPYANFQQMTVDAQATGDKVTVVLDAGMQNPARHQHVFWDSASLTVVAGGTADAGGGEAVVAAPPPPPAIAAEVVAQGEQGDGSIIHTVRTGDTLAGIAVAYGLDIMELLDLNGLDMQSARILSPGQELIVRAADPNAAASSGDDESSDDGSESSEGGEGDLEGSSESGASAEKPIEEYEAAPVAVAAVPVRMVTNVTGGTICAALFEDSNPNRLQEGGEGLLAGGQITLVKDGAAVESFTTDGESEPVCTGDLGEGDYMVQVQPPGGYGVTTAASYAVMVAPGKTVDVLFGAAPGFTSPQAPAPQTGTGLFSDEAGMETDTVSGPLDIVFDYTGVIVLVLAGVTLLGGLGLALILRR